MIGNKYKSNNDDNNTESGVHVHHNALWRPTHFSLCLPKIMFTRFVLQQLISSQLNIYLYTYFLFKSLEIKPNFLIKPVIFFSPYFYKLERQDQTVGRVIECYFSTPKALSRHPRLSHQGLADRNAICSQRTQLLAKHSLSSLFISSIFQMAPHPTYSELSFVSLHHQRRTSLFVLIFLLVLITKQLYLVKFSQTCALTTKYLLTHSLLYRIKHFTKNIKYITLFILFFI